MVKIIVTFSDKVALEIQEEVKKKGFISRQEFIRACVTKHFNRNNGMA